MYEMSIGGELAPARGPRDKLQSERREALWKASMLKGILETWKVSI